MGYIDDVEFFFRPDATTVEYRSASRLGERDFDANRKRIRDLRVALQETVRSAQYTFIPAHPPKKRKQNSREPNLQLTRTFPLFVHTQRRQIYLRIHDGVQSVTSLEVLQGLVCSPLTGLIGFVRPGTRICSLVAHEMWP